MVVGDIALLEPGEIIPCDGIFLSGYNVKCDESAATGETNAIKEAPYSYCIKWKHVQSPQENSSMSHTDCFIVSSSKDLEGVGCYVVVAVGAKSFSERIMVGMFFRHFLLAVLVDLKSGHRHGEHPSLAQTERSCGIHCQSWKCSRQPASGDHLHVHLTHSCLM